MRRRNAVVISSDRELGPAVQRPDEMHDMNLPESSRSAADQSSNVCASSNSVGPKVVKVDSALKSLVPAALRVKRTAGETEKTSQLQPMKAIRYSEGNTRNQTVSSSDGVHTLRAASGASVVSSSQLVKPSLDCSVDDAYADFMNEIKLLDGSNAS